MSKLKFDLSKKGLECVLKPYQVEIMRHFWATQMSMDSRTVHEHLLGAEVEGAKSRASVIFFLNDMVDEGFLDYVERTTKGGHKRVYSLNWLSKAEDVFKSQIIARFNMGLLKFGKKEAEG